MTNTEGRNVYAASAAETREFLSAIGANLCIVNNAERIEQSQQNFSPNNQL